jgi:hypothetical protein
VRPTRWTGVAPRAASVAGQATVELAVLLPVVAVLLLTVAQVALLARERVLVTHAAREGARVAAVGGDAGAVRGAVVEAGGLDPAGVEVRVTRRAERVEVRVDYRARTDLPIVGALMGDPSMTARVTMRREEPP